MLDLIIKNGDCYIDNDLKNVDIGIQSGKIVKIGNLEEEEATPPPYSGWRPCVPRVSPTPLLRV